MTPAQVAEVLAIKEKTVLGWLRQGKLKGVRVGRLWRIRESDLTAFLEGPQPKQPEDDEGPPPT